MEPVGLYLHWPFCERKCPYCDFYTFGREHPAYAGAAPFAAALRAELRSGPARLGRPGPVAADTIYFGGGTPSLMPVAALAELLSDLRATYALAPGAEVTLEVNPTTAETAELPARLALGVNRLSVGAQSFSDAALKRLGRVHDAATTRRALAAVRAAGVRNLSLDLMFGVPGQTLAAFAADLEAALAWAPEHLSAYNLTLHVGTPFARWHAAGRLVLPGEEAEVRMFEHLMDRLAGAGYVHYEISNWARPGYEARHNGKYWRPCDVLGFGPAAHGVVAGRRFANPPDLAAYLERDGRKLWIEQDPPATERARTGEIMMLALRRVAGVPWAELNAWAGGDLRARYAPELARLTDEGLLTGDTATLRLTRRGILVSDAVMEAFF